ncbi:MAG: DUF2911 domain-containing protein [Candidatus Korobacteraceae bacterium]
MRHALVLAITFAAACCSAFGQNSTSTNPGPATATCDFSDQQQLAVQYQKLELGKKDKDFLGRQVPYGKVWEPGKQPLTLFTNSPVSIAGTNVPVGAYTMYLIPDKKDWMLVVSKNTSKSAAYDQSKDLVRVPMQTGQLPSPEPDFSIYFAHTGPKECTMRVDVADIRAWVPFEQR